MSKSPLSRPQVQESVGRSAVDLSAPRNFHQSAGMLIPVFSRAFIAGTDGYIDRKSFVRTKTPLFPAFQQLTQCVDLFMIPLRYLYTPWNDWKLNINDINSSRFPAVNDGQIDLNLMTSVPRANISGIAQALYNIVSASDGDEIAIREVNLSNRLFDALDYGQSTIFNPRSRTFTQNLFMLAAYQKVYFDFYRNTAYESNNPYAYNLDWLWNQSAGLLDTSGGDAIAEFVLRSLTRMRYANYRNDYFHNLYPSLNLVESTPSGSSWNVPSNVVGISSIGPAVANNSNNMIPREYDGNVSVGNQFTTSYIQQYARSGVMGPTVQQIRAAFALDKLMRATAYTPKHVKEQFKARFDVDVPDSVGMESIRLGSWQNDITFGEVTSTANTVNSETASGDSLGAVGGKGVGAANDGRIHFHCKEDSIVMAIQYFVPQAMYDSKGVSTWNTKLVREDFYQPEFQNLGLRPMYVYEIENIGDVAANNIILGYTVPNQYYKVPIAKNYGIFNQNYSRAIAAGGVVTPIVQTSPLSAFTTHTGANMLRQNTYDADGVNSTWFKVYPEHINGLFEEDYDATNDDYGTDQFYGQVRFGCQITHNMTVHGMPSI